MEWSVKGIHPLILKSLLERQEQLGRSLGPEKLVRTTFAISGYLADAIVKFSLWSVSSRGYTLWGALPTSVSTGFHSQKCNTCTCRLTAAATIGSWSQSEGQLHPATLHSNSHSPTMKERKNTKNSKRLLWTIIYQQIGQLRRNE